MVCCRLSAVGCRCSNVCTKTCITCLMLKRSRKNPKKEKKMPANTNYTFHKSANAFAHCSSRSHSLFFLQNTRSEKCRSNIISGIFLYSGIFLNFFFPNLFPMDFFVIFFPSHAKHFSWKILSAETGFSHNCHWTFFGILLNAPLNFFSLQRFVSCEFEEKYQPIFKSVNRRAFTIQCGIFSRKKKKNSMICSNCADGSIANLYKIDFSLINAENHKHISKVRNIHLYFSHGNHPCIHHGQYAHNMYWKRNSPRKKNQLIPWNLAFWTNIKHFEWWTMLKQTKWFRNVSVRMVEIMIANFVLSNIRKCSKFRLCDKFAFRVVKLVLFGSAIAMARACACLYVCGVCCCCV